MKDLTLPLMSDNISRDDIDCLVEFSTTRTYTKINQWPEGS